MENKTYKTWLIVVIILGLLLTCAGTAAGGLVGFAIGRGRGATYQRPYRDQHPMPQRPWNIRPMPEWPRMPEMPDIDPGERMPFFSGMAVEIIEVIEDSPADAAGLEVGDYILAIEGNALADVDLAELVGAFDPGDRVELLILRDGDQRTVQVKLGRHPDRGGETAWLGIGYRLISLELLPHMHEHSD